jgi:lipid-binding SYLF domain-containing protein
MEPSVLKTERSRIGEGIMKKTITFALAALMLVCVNTNVAEARASNADRRSKIDAIAKDALNVITTNRERAQDLFDKSYGWSVFDNFKLSLGISGGGGRGVAVRKAENQRIYMNMGTVGLNIGLGAQKYQVVFFFEDKGTFDDFVNKGWQADANANAVAGIYGANAESAVGSAGANYEASFNNGLALFQITDAGLMLQADIAGTKFWKNKKLNKK